MCKCLEGGVCGDAHVYAGVCRYLCRVACRYGRACVYVGMCVSAGICASRWVCGGMCESFYAGVHRCIGVHVCSAHMCARLCGMCRYMHVHICMDVQVHILMILLTISPQTPIPLEPVLTAGLQGLSFLSPCNPSAAPMPDLASIYHLSNGQELQRVGQAPRLRRHKPVPMPGKT